MAQSKVHQAVKELELALTTYPNKNRLDFQQQPSTANKKMNLSSTIKSIQDIMRKDDGVDGDACLGQLMDVVSQSV